MIHPENLIIRVLEGPALETLPVEVVERKGLGHPDTLCDAIAERISVRLCHYYLHQFGVILHHNVDKVLLCGGASRACFGGGEILAPIDIYLAGRATQEWRGEKIPVHEIAIAACNELLSERIPDLDVTRHVRVTSRIGAGSTDLTRLFGRGGKVPLANDTSCGAGFAPPTDLERVVLAVDRRLSCSEVRRERPAIGADIKVMGIRRGDRIALTIGCAFIGRHISGVDAYAREKEAARALALEATADITNLEVDAIINAADDLGSGDVFLTVIGTSAEAGDDGEVGRGNRTNGLITPYRFMTMEAAAGKNPVSHVGKLYNVLAGRMAGAIAADVAGVRGATTVLVSQIGRPVDDPQVADIQLALENHVRAENVRTEIERIVSDELEAIPSLREELLQERIRLY